MKIIGINGIESDGRNSTDRMGEHLVKRGFEFMDLNQPIRSAWGARFHAHEDAMDIVKVAEDGDYALCHSYGGLKTAIAAKVVKFKAIFMFRPAMSRWHRFAKVDPDTKIFCIYSKQDYTILVGALAFYHPFGLAGFSGFKSKRAKNIESQGAHSNDFKHPSLIYWADFIKDTIELLENPE